jgi:hypothetical protein
LKERQKAELSNPFNANFAKKMKEKKKEYKK